MHIYYVDSDSDDGKSHNRVGSKSCSQHDSVRSKSIAGYYAIPTNYTSVGVTAGRGARSPIDRQPVTKIMLHDKCSIILEIRCRVTRSHMCCHGYREQCAETAMSHMH